MLNRTLLPIVLLSFLGCSHEPTRPKPEDIQQDLETFRAESSYHPESRAPGTPVDAHWNNGSRHVDIVFWAPESSGKYPLIIYLPGLGQDAASAPLWREAWVKAGFAVLSIQHHTDATALSHLSPEDRHDLKSIGHEHFNHHALDGRLKDLSFAFHTLESQIKAGKAPFTQARTDQLALAGFDLGSQTVQAMAGEHIKGIQLPDNLPPAQALILLSPYVDLAQGGMQHRFEALSAPLLVVTGSDDHDPWGVTSPSVRSTPWQQAQGGNKYLLNLTNGTHRQLAGIDPMSQKPEDQEEDPDESRHNEEKERDENSGGSHGRGGHGGQGGGRQRGTQFGDARRGFGPGYNPKHYGRQLAIIQTVSTAYLNAALRNDRSAADWLRNEATRWMGTAAELHIR